MLEFLFADVNGDYTDSLVETSGFEAFVDINAQVGDLVMYSESADDTVDVVEDNFDSRSVVGIITDKPTTTTAIVMTKGQISGLTGLTKTKKAYLGSNGEIAVIKPSTGNFQILGHSTDTGVLNFNPVNTKIIQPPDGYDTEAEAEANPVDVDTTPLVNPGDTMTQTYNV